MPTKKIDQALILMEKVGSLLRDAKEEISNGTEVSSKQAVRKQAVSKDAVNLNIDKWPKAVNPNLICSADSEQDKVDRANGVVELMIEENLNDKKFLDFGCGEGHTVDVTTKHKTVVSVGYDIVENNWSGKSGVLTTDMDVVEENGPYDVIIVFDVLDHIGPFDNLDAPKSILKKAAELLSPEGKMYLRCHPWVSRHGTHMYHWENKAYAHLVFTDEELTKAGVKLGEKTQKVTKPIATYRSWIKEAGLKVDNERVIKDPVEDFFKSPKIEKRITKNVGMGSFPEFQMSIAFIDYILVKN